MDPLLAILKNRVTTSVIPTTYDEPFFASYPLLMAILKSPRSCGVSCFQDMSYGETILWTGRRLMAILDLLPHAVMAQGVANSMHFGHPGFPEVLQRVVRFCATSCLSQ